MTEFSKVWGEIKTFVLTIFFQIAVLNNMKIGYKNS